ncbi:MAG: response regulator [Desulfobacterales bacterium]
MDTAPKGHILIVDDDKGILFLVSRMLKKLGYETTTAQDGLEALEKTESQGSFDFVLTDIHMPAMDGWELALRIKERNPTLPVAALTGDVPEYIGPRLEGSGICHVFYKPMDLNEFEEVVPGVMSGSIGAAPPTNGIATVSRRTKAL